MPGRVEGLVRDMPRLDPFIGKITVSQGIVIDPKHPNEATVFALVMDQEEIGRFRDRLQIDFPNQFKEVPPDPIVVTQLSEIGQVAVSSGPRATVLSPPPAKGELKTALRTPAPPKNQTMIYRPSPEFDGMTVPEVPPRPPVSSDDLAAAKASPERESNGLRTSSTNSTDLTASVPGGKEDSAPANPPNLESPVKGRQQLESVVLVWVTTRNPIQKSRR
ncbi:hypothetical protein V5E97_16285 [Singulisphaera sp. Ch08]|uniref:Uncharacterized protein n=1 Tax=Singulisphaera sp. Ch08 TaxID=3120278 RepID=A0AAU7CQ39_9BACT